MCPTSTFRCTNGNGSIRQCFVVKVKLNVNNLYVEDKCCLLISIFERIYYSIRSNGILNDRPHVCLFLRFYHTSVVKKNFNSHQKKKTYFETKTKNVFLHWNRSPQIIFVFNYLLISIDILWAQRIDFFIEHEYNR